MGSFARLFRLMAVLCLALLPVIGRAQDEIAVPPGYEDAPVAGEPAPAVEAEEAQPVQVGGMAAIFDADPNLTNLLEKQFLPQFQPLWQAEVAFVRRVCQPNQAQRDHVERAKDRCTTAAAREYARANSSGRGGMDPFGGRATAAIDPRVLIQKQMARLVKEGLSPEQSAQYQDECERRDAHRKQAAVLNLIARLDEELLLTAEQRDRLVESLDSHYQDAWGQSLQTLQHNRQYLPSIPDQHVVPILNETQRAIWRSAQKIGMAGVAGFGNAVVVVRDVDRVGDADENE